MDYALSVLLKWRDRLDRKFRNRHDRDPRVCKLCVTKTHYQQGRLGRKKENVGDGYQIEYRSDYKGSSRFQNYTLHTVMYSLYTLQHK